MNPATALARVLVDEFVRHGLTDAVLAPGSRSAPLAMALHDEARVRLHVEIDERSAAFLALGLGKATRRPAAVLSTSGTAAANFHPAVVEASQARVPLLILTADRPPELRDTGANQTIDQVKLYGDTVRWFAEIGVPEARPGAVAYWRSLASRAYAATVVSPPGPVHCNVALREPLVPSGDGFDQPLDGRAGNEPWTAVARSRQVPSEADVERLAARVADTERGLVVVGSGVDDPGALVALADHAAWPLLAEGPSGARTGPPAISTYHLLLSHPPFAAAHRPDFVLRAGRVALSRPLLGLLDAGVPQLLVDPDGAWLDPTRSAARLVTADPALLAEAVCAHAPRRDASGWLGAWAAAEDRARDALDEILDGLQAPTEPRLARDLADALPDGAALVVASSMPVRDLDSFMRPRARIRILANRGASGIDGFVSTALGVALAHDGPVVALAGDLSLLHDSNGLLLAERPDLVLVVANNDGGGIFSFLPQAQFPHSFERLFGTPHGLDLAQLARTYDCAHTLLRRAADLPAVLRAAVEGGGVHIVEARTERQANVALHRRLAAAVASAL